MTEYKQAIVIRTDTEMRKGKMCGQVAHASVSAFVEATKDDEFDQFDAAWKWFKHGNQTKVVLKVGSEAELEAIAKKAEDAGLIVARIHDAGHTQIDPHTFTCIGIGPDKAENIDAITGDLKLL